MAVKVKWTGNAANLPKERKNNTTPTVRYVGMGPGGNTYQPYLETDDTTGAGTVKSTAKNDQQGKFNVGQYAGDAGKLFINGIAEGLAATGANVENLIGKGLDKLFPGAGFEGSGLFNALYNGRPDWKWAGENGLVGIKQDREYNQESLQQNADNISSKILKKAAEFGGDIAYGLGNAAPMAAEAMATGGASMAANLTKEGLLKTGAEVVEKTGVLNTLSKATRDLLTSKDYWTSFASEVGMDYYDAKDNGATEDEALRYALYSAGLNSVIEIGGGIQKIPERPNFKTWLKSAHEEGMEEVQQGIVSRLLENAVYNKGNPIVSVTEDNAVINPVNALGEYAGGAAVGGILSGGQQLTQRAINRSVRAEQNKQAKKVYGDSAQDLVAESLELSPNNELATRLQKKLDNGEDLTGDDLRQLVEQNENSMVASDKASILSAVENRLSELGATNNVSKMAEIITQQISGEDVADSDRHLVESSKAGRQVRQELNPENIRVGAENEAWTGNIGTARINTTAYNRDMQKTGVTGAKYNAETGKLDAIVTNEAGEVKTVPAAEAEMTPMQEELFDWADELKLEAAGPLMVRAYQPEQNMELYTRSFKLAYEYGKAGMPMDYVEKSEGVNYLHPTQIKLAYEEGQAATQRKVQAREERIRSGGTTDSTTKKKGSVSLRGATVGGKTYAPVNRKTVDSRQWASVKVMRAFSRAVGVDVVFYQSQANERGVYEGANGFYKDGMLYLDINAGRDTVGMTETAILKTAAHELTHFIQANSAQYEALKSFVVNKLTHEEGVSFEDLVADKQRREPGLEYDEAVDEVVADACEMMLGNSTVVEQLAKENRSLAEKIRDWLREWVENLKIALEGLQADRTESRAMMQYAQELQEIWDNALVGAARSNRGTESKTRYSYSGVRAKTANRSALQKAVEMRNKEKSNEEIRKETGWFVGMDGKWRFEISDADIRFDAEGELQGKNKNDVKTLADYISHEKLFEAYPDLADVPVYFAEMQNGNYGSYSRGLDEIALNRSLLEDPKELLVTLVHEIQHAIQERERFAPGASKAYWNRRLEEGADVRTRKEKQEIARLQKELDDMKKSDPEFVADMEKLEKMTPSVSRGAINWDTLEQIEPDPPEWVAFDKERDQLEEKYGDRIFDWFFLRDQIEMNGKYREWTPGELYYNTAGEIEARDSAARRTLTEAQRKEKAPNMGNDNTVFAEGNGYFSMSAEERDGIAEQLRQNQELLNTMKVVAKVNSERFLGLSTGEARKAIVEELKKTGYQVDRQGMGKITFTPAEINESLNYKQKDPAAEDARRVGFLVLKDVLKRGIEIREHGKHKGRNYDTITIAAPVEINGVRVNMAAVVKRTKGNKYKVHRILTPAGRVFALDKKANAEMNTVGAFINGSQSLRGSAPAINSASKNNIRQTAANSQEKSSDKPQNQQREPRLSDRDVLRRAADMAQRDRSQRWSVEDLNRFDLLKRKLLQLDEANAELEALEEERKVLLAGRKVKELTRDEQFDLAQNRNRTETQKGKIQRLEEETYKIESVPQVKALLKKSRSIVEREADSKARAEFREAREKQEMLDVTRRKVERNAKRLLEYMNTNTDKKHIPEALKKPIGELLESLDFYSNSARKGGNKTRADQRYCEAMQGLQSALAAQKLFDDTGEGTDLFKGYLDLPAGFESMLGVHVERVKTAMEKHPLKTDIVRKMDLDDLRDLDVILSVMSRSVTKMNEMFVNRRFAYVADAAEDSIDSMDRL